VNPSSAFFGQSLMLRPLGLRTCLFSLSPFRPFLFPRWYPGELAIFFDRGYAKTPQCALGIDISFFELVSLLAAVHYSKNCVFLGHFSFRSFLEPTFFVTLLTACNPFCRFPCFLFPGCHLAGRCDFSPTGPPVAGSPVQAVPQPAFSVF